MQVTEKYNLNKLHAALLVMLSDGYEVRDKDVGICYNLTKQAELGSSCGGVFNGYSLVTQYCIYKGYSNFADPISERLRGKKCYAGSYTYSRIGLWEDEEGIERILMMQELVQWIESGECLLYLETDKDLKTIYPY